MADGCLALRPARADEARQLAAWASEASSGIDDYVWAALRPPDDPDRDLLDIGAEQYAMPGVSWGYEFVDVAEADGAPAGMVHHHLLRADDDPSDDAVFNAFARLEAAAAGHWYVSNMIVDPEHRGRGFGRALLRHATDAGARAGCPATSLLVFEGNAAAVALYESAGFRKTGANPMPPDPLIRGQGDLLILSQPADAAAGAGTSP